VVGVQDEQQVQRLGRHRVELQRLARHLEHHVQEALDVLEVVARITERPADRVAVAGRGDGRHLGDQADRGELAVGRVIDVEVVVVEGRERSDRGGQHGHRVRVVVEALEEVLQRLVHHRVMRDLVLEGRVLVLLRQLAVEQQVGHFQEGRLLGQLLDRVAAVEQHALVTVDVGDRALGAGGGAEAGIVGEVAGVLVQRAQVDAGGAQRAAQQGQLGAAVARFIDELDDLGIGHGNLLHERRTGGSRGGHRPAREWHRARGKRPMQPSHYRTSAAQHPPADGPDGHAKDTGRAAGPPRVLDVTRPPLPRRQA